MKYYKCEDCKDTGWVNENGAGFHGESMPCECRGKGKQMKSAVEQEDVKKLIDEMIEKHGDEPASIALTELKNKLEAK